MTVTSRVTSFLVSCPSSVLSWDVTAVPALSLRLGRGGKTPSPALAVLALSEEQLQFRYVQRDLDELG